QGQLGANERDVGIEPQQVWHSTDVVLVPVRQYDGHDVIEPIFNVVEVWQDQINTGLDFFRKQDASVNDEQLPVEFKDRHVATDITKSAERNDTAGAVTKFRWMS